MHEGRKQTNTGPAHGEIEFNIFGERWSVPGSPEIVVVSNVTEDGRPIGVRRAGKNWHSDMCYASRPPRGTMLYALEIPKLFGLALGDTEFASTAAAWDALPERMQRHLDGRRAVFDFAGRKPALPPTQAEMDRYPPITHPIVRTHPVTGRKCLYVMRDDCIGIEGIEGWEAETLIAALADHTVKPAFVYRHQWRVGDLLMWDNWAEIEADEREVFELLREQVGADLRPRVLEFINNATRSNCFVLNN